MLVPTPGMREAKRCPPPQLLTHSQSASLVRAGGGSARWISNSQKQLAVGSHSFAWELLAMIESLNLRHWLLVVPGIKTRQQKLLLSGSAISQCHLKSQIFVKR